MRIVLAIVLLVAAACTSEEDDGKCQGGTTDAMSGETSMVITVGGDFSGNGILTKVSIPSMEVTVNAVAGVVGGDPVLRAIGDRLLVIDRFGGDTVTILDRDLRLIGQVSTGSGSNPQDATIVGDSLFVVLYGESKVIRFNLQNLAEGIVSETDLSSLDPDGNANCASIYAIGETLFVSCQLLEPDFSAKGPGKVAIIDTATGLLSRSLELQAANPLSFLKKSTNGDLLLSTVLNPAGFDPLAKGSGCLERISTDSPAKILPCELTNRELGGYVSEMVADDDSIFFIKSIAFGLATLHELKEGTLLPLELSCLGDNLVGITRCPSGELVVSDNTVGARGLRVYSGPDFAGGELLEVGWPTVAFPSNGTICW